MNEKYVVAKYLRLSSDDGIHGDSQSITGQRELINNFINSKNEFKEVYQIEYNDDGFSGTNFLRPSVKQLLEDAKKGLINCIIVKDFSRFGRNYIDVGDYIEQIFPFLNIRFISINDCYDSSLQQCNAGDISIAFKHIMNDYYSKDLSRKVKSGYKTKWESGMYLSGYDVYGYKKSEENKYKLVINKDTAPIVRRIFDLALAGNSNTKIATLLNKDEILSPMDYLIKSKNSKAWSDLKHIWTNIKVINILRDIRYTGTITNGMYAVCEVGSKIKHKKPESEWFITENAHEPIISKEEFEKAQSCIRKFKKSKQNREASPYTFPVKIRCCGCSHAMIKNNAKVMMYYCRYKHTIPDNKCFKGKIKYTVLKDVILLSIKKLYDYVYEYKSTAFNEKCSNEKTNKNYLLQKEIERLTNLKIILYTRFQDDEINKEVYLKQSETIVNKINDLTSQLTELNEQKDIKKNEVSIDNSILSLIERNPNPEQNFNEAINELIEHVIVYDEDRVEIIWKFQFDFGLKS